jgi:hypothetical protein
MIRRQAQWNATLAGISERLEHQLATLNAAPVGRWLGDAAKHLTIAKAIIDADLRAQPKETDDAE